MELAIYFKAHYRAGSAGYYDGAGRGECAIYHDSQVWIYHSIPKGERIAFKRAAGAAFAGRGMPDAKIAGIYPNYTAETRG